MKADNFWFITLCAFLIISLTIGWSIPLRVAIVANSLVILLNIIKQVRCLFLGRKKEEN